MEAERKNMKVVVRVRPFNSREREKNHREIIKFLDETTLLFDPDEETDEFFFQAVKQTYRDMTKRVNKKISMEFNRVFGPDATNEQIFKECISPLIISMLNGYNCSVFVYGATGAGKTFTMLGNNTCSGLTILTMCELFRQMDANDTYEFNVGVSYLEVYNELVMNLLTKSGPLRLCEDSRGVVVCDLALVPIYTAQDVLCLLKQGNLNRTQHPTYANAESSRSHAVFQVHIRMIHRISGSKRTVKLSMIDLAGSERATSSNSVAARFKEGVSINKSLLALGSCINKLADGVKHIPYRDSNLTLLLKDSLGGNCQTIMIANVSMSSLTYDDTYNTLKYASRAKTIRTAIRRNELTSNKPNVFYEEKILELTKENKRLKESTASLKAKCKQLVNTANASRFYEEIDLKDWYNKIDAVYLPVAKAQEYLVRIESEIKQLNFRTKLKETNNTIILKLNQPPTNVMKSAYNMNKSVEKLEGESTRWRKKLHDAEKELEMLQTEIKKSEYAFILQIYQRSKDLEVRSLTQNININHVSSINLELVRESDNFQKGFSMACEVLGKSYEHLGTEMQGKVEQLQKLISALNSNDEYKHDSVEDIQVSEIISLGNYAKRNTESILPRSTGKHHLQKHHDIVQDIDVSEINSLRTYGKSNTESILRRSTRKHQLKKRFDSAADIEGTEINSLGNYAKRNTESILPRSTGKHHLQKHHDIVQDIDVSEINSLRTYEKSNTESIFPSSRRKQNLKKCLDLRNGPEEEDTLEKLFPSQNNLNQTYVLSSTTEDEKKCRKDENSSRATEKKITRPPLKAGPLKTDLLRSTNFTHKRLLKPATEWKCSTDESSSTATKGKMELIDNLLSENITRLPSNAGPLKTALLKSKNVTLKRLSQTVTAMKKDRNRHSPARIGKIPATSMVKAITKTGKGKTLRAVPVVRMNRTTSLRLKNSK